MTDAGRKDFSTKAKESMQPDSSKSTTDKVSESVSGAGDKAARAVQPDNDKSSSQAIGDKVGRSKDDHTGESVMDKTKNALGMGDKH